MLCAVCACTVDERALAVRELANARGAAHAGVCQLLLSAPQLLPLLCTA